MDRALRGNRKRDEYEIENDSGNDFSADSEDEDPDFIPSDNESDENNSSDDSDEENIEPLDQSTSEENAANPQNKYWSKDKKIEYLSQPFEFSRRNSFRRAENIVPGRNIHFLLCCIICVLSHIRMFSRICFLIHLICLLGFYCCYDVYRS